VDKYAHMLIECESYIILQFVQVALFQLSMSSKRSYYRNDRFMVKKRKVSSEHHIDDGDDVLAGTAAFVTLTSAYGNRDFEAWQITIFDDF